MLMKERLLIIACLFCNLILSAQNSLSGNYYSRAGICLRIEQDSFKLIMPNAARNGYYSEIMAEGKIKVINESFIELNSTIIPYMKALESINITEKEDSALNDSIEIKFSIPYQREILKIMVFTDTFKTFELNYSKNSRSLKIPNDVNAITLSIRPEYIMPHNPEGLFYGILEFNSMEYPIKKNSNLIEISIPAIDDSFFEKYYVKGDYAKVSKNAITWKGEGFKKNK